MTAWHFQDCNLLIADVVMVMVLAVLASKCCCQGLECVTKLLTSVWHPVTELGAVEVSCWKDLRLLAPYTEVKLSVCQGTGLLAQQRLG